MRTSPRKTTELVRATQCSLSAESLEAGRCHILPKDPEHGWGVPPCPVEHSLAWTAAAGGVWCGAVWSWRVGGKGVGCRGARLD